MKFLFPPALSDRLLLRGVPTNGLAWWSLTSLPGERSRLKPRSLRISRNKCAMNVFVPLLGWGWTYVFPGKSAKGQFLSIPQEMKNCWSLRICSWFTRRQFFRNLSHRNSRILSTYSWWFVSGSSISNTAQISLVGKLPYDVGSLSIRVPYDEILAA